MPADPTDFDPYHKWLGIPRGKRPPTHYDLLGVDLDEDDDEVVRAAAEQRRAFVETKLKTPRADAARGVLYQLGEAAHVLTDPASRRDYDRRLGLFDRRGRRRRVDPNAPPSRVRAAARRPAGGWWQGYVPGAGEDADVLRTAAGVFLLLTVCLGGLFALTFGLWDRGGVKPRVGPPPNWVAPAAADPAAAAAGAAGPRVFGQHGRFAPCLAVLTAGPAEGRVITGGDDGRVLCWDPDGRPGAVGRGLIPVWAFALPGGGKIRGVHAAPDGSAV